MANQLIIGGGKIENPDPSGNGTLTFGDIFITNVASTVTASQFEAKPQQPVGNGLQIDVSLFYSGGPTIPAGNSVLILNSQNINLLGGASVPSTITRGTLYVWYQPDASQNPVSVGVGVMSYQNPGVTRTPGNDTIQLVATYSCTQQGTAPNILYTYLVNTTLVLPDASRNPSTYPLVLMLDSDPDGQPHLEFTCDYPDDLPTTPPPSNPPPAGYTTYTLTPCTQIVNSAELKNVVVTIAGKNKKVKCIATNQTGTK